MGNHNPKIGYKNFSLYNIQKSLTTRVSTQAIKMSPNNKLLINSAQIGKTVCMSEIINVKLKDNTLVKLKMYYDSQSQHTLCNQAAKALMTSTQLSKCKIQLETVMGKDCKKRNICKLKISDEHEIDAILIDNLQIGSFFMEKPKEWVES